MNGGSLQRLVISGALNSPWGMAIAPASFGLFSNDLLVGNFGNGNIEVYDPSTGAAIGALKDTNGNTISIDGLWALQVGNGKSGGDSNAVYFTAGPGDESHGLFGSLQAGPVPSTGGPVLNGADFAAGIAEYAWISVFGANLSSTTRPWSASDMPGGKLPTQLDGVSVTIDGKPAYISYISPTQINALVAADLSLGTIAVVATNQGLSSAAVSATMQMTAPAFFITKSNYIAALHANDTVVGPANLYPNSTPAAPGEIIRLFGTGFGQTSTPIPDGQVITTAIPMSGVSVTVGGAPAQLNFQGLVMPGLYQFNVVIPLSTPNGDAEVVATVGGSVTPTGPLVSVHN